MGHGVGDNMSNLIASNMITQITLGLSEVPRILLLDSLSDCALLKALKGLSKLKKV